MSCETYKKPRGAAATAGNKEKYAAEIGRMETAHKKFPSNQLGKASVEGFAKRLGFTRKVLDKGGALADQFVSDVNRIGVESKSGGNSGRRVNKTEDKSKGAPALHKELLEVESYKAQVENLTKRVAELELAGAEKERAFEHMLATGERFFL